MLHPGEAPGLGVEIDEALAAKYPYKRAYLPVNRLEDGTMYELVSALRHPPVFHIATRDGNHLTLASDGPAIAHVFVLEDDIIRVMLLPDGALKQPRTWAIAPGLDDVPDAGRDRFDLSGFALPDFTLEESDGKMNVETAKLRLTIKLAGFFCSWKTSGVTVLRDRPTQAYDFGWWDGKRAHYLVREPGERYFGLGERSGDADRAGRRFRMSNVDAMGYSAAHHRPALQAHPVLHHCADGDGRCGAVLRHAVATAPSTWAASAATITACSAASSPITAISTIT